MAVVALAWCALAASPASAQETDDGSIAMSSRDAADAARNSVGTRVLISLAERRLRVVVAEDTILSAPVAVGSNRTLRALLAHWHFNTPTGVTRVVAKEVQPAWIPPDWHYVEVAQQHGLRVERLREGAGIRLSNGRVLSVRGDGVGVIAPDSTFSELPLDEEIVFDNTLFIPPFGSRNRVVAGVLGPYRLLLGNGVGLHGTPDQASIGEAVTHGCIRLRDDDVTWLYVNVPVGTLVVIY